MHRAGTTDRAKLTIHGIHDLLAHGRGALGGGHARRVLDHREGDWQLALD